MSTHPRDVWSHLSPQLQAQIRAELTAVIQEVIYDYIGTYHPPASDSQGYHLYTAVQPAPSAHQPGESASAVRPARARQGVGLAAGGD